MSCIPNSHVVGPNGFIGLFIKQWWPIVKQDFLRLFKDFSDNSIDLTSINSSIAFVPNRSNPKIVDDFRPMSLLNYSHMTITKLLYIQETSISHPLAHPHKSVWVLRRQNHLGLLSLGLPISPHLSSFQKGNSHPKIGFWKSLCYDWAPVHHRGSEI